MASGWASFQEYFDRVGSIIKKDRFKMAPGFRLVEVGILSGCSILLRKYG